MIVLTANDFASGAVVYHGKDGWVLSIQQAEIFQDEDDAQEALNNADQRPDLIVGAYLIAVNCVNGKINPTHIREQIRSTGPTHHNVQSAQEVHHVSIS